MRISDWSSDVCSSDLPFIAVAEFLCEQGLNAPTIIARNLEQGLLLIEDFGDVRLRETVDAALHKEAEYYAGVTDLLVHLHARPPMDGLPVDRKSTRLNSSH